MTLICKIVDEDINENSIEMTNPILRLAARGIILRENGKIAVFNKSNKNEYKLPGGGIEGHETPQEAFKREVLEETGCEIEIVQKLGITEEIKSLENFRHISYVFVGKVIKDTKKLNMTQREIDQGGKLLWETPEEALELITKFRDRKILEYYLN